MWLAGTDHALRAELKHSYQLAMQQAAEVFERLLQQPVTLELPVILPAVQLQREAELAPPGLGISLAIDGELSGGLLLFFSPSTATWFCGQLLGERPVDLLTEPARSTLQEVGNILASALLASLEDRLQIRAVPAPPQISLAPLTTLFAQLRGGRPHAASLVSSRLSCAPATENSVLISSYLCPASVALERLLARVAAGKH